MPCLIEAFKQMRPEEARELAREMLEMLEMGPSEDEMRKLFLGRDHRSRESGVESPEQPSDGSR